MLLIVGLGNPGSRHAANRHNIGFMALDALAARHGFSPWRQRFQGEVAEGRLGEDKVLALKPMTFMNESGRAVGEALRFYKAAPEDVLVLHDELDLSPGKVKLKRGGGHAGHNGLRSIIAHIGPDFRRLRLGIGHPGHKDRVHAYVLSDFAKQEQDWLERLLDAVAKEALLLTGDQAAASREKAEAAFMSKVNQAVFPQRPKAAKTSSPESGHASTSAPETPALESPPPAEARQSTEGGPVAQALRRVTGKLGLSKIEKD